MWVAAVSDSTGTAVAISASAATLRKPSDALVDNAARKSSRGSDMMISG